MRRPLELSNSPATASAPAKRVCGGEQRKRSDAVHALFLASAWGCSASWFHERLSSAVLFETQPVRMPTYSGLQQ